MLATQELEIARNLPPDGCSIEQAEQYTRWLATHHYENFTVASWLLPRRLHQHFYNVYAYCRWADDLGDEVADPARALELLDSWEEDLRRAYARNPSHPVLIALAGTARDCEIPAEPFSNLLKAFRQDQTVHRYGSWEDLLAYCRYSANPVGRLVLYVCGYRDGERQALSDSICTALQLANFWQDVARDLEKGRIYIPLDSMSAHEVTEEEIVTKKFSNRYARLMQDLIARTRALFKAGAPLAQSVAPELRVDIELFLRGGLAVLDAIALVGYDTLHHRPALGASAQMRLFGRAVVSRVLRPARASRGSRGSSGGATFAGRNA